MTRCTDLDASIVIRTKNEAAFIGKTLARIDAQDFPGEWEVIIVDSGSTDATLEKARRYNVRAIEMPERRFSYGRALNIGAAAAQGAFIVNLSAHAVPVERGWLRCLIEACDVSEVAGVYGRQIAVGAVNPFEARKNELFFGARRMRFTPGDSGRLRGCHFSNSNCAIRKNVWEKIHFDEEVRWAEDLIWQRKAIAAGYSIVYAPSAVVYHTHSVDIHRAYKASRDCAVALATTDGRRQARAVIMYDIAVFLGLLPHSVFQNLRYVLEKKYLRHLGVTPVYVASTWLGWLAGMFSYRWGAEHRDLA